MAASVESGEIGFYTGCWPLSSRPVVAGVCTSLDAEGCATRADCVTHFELGANAGAFMGCVDESLYH